MWLSIANWTQKKMNMINMSKSKVIKNEIGRIKCI